MYPHAGSRYEILNVIQNPEYDGSRAEMEDSNGWNQVNTRGKGNDFKRQGGNKKELKQAGRSSKPKSSNPKPNTRGAFMDWPAWSDGARELANQMQMDQANPTKISKNNEQQEADPMEENDQITHVYPIPSLATSQHPTRFLVSP